MSNSTFKGISTIVGQVPKIHASVASVSTNLDVGGHIDGMMPVDTLIAYTPMNWNTTPAPFITQLQTKPNVDPAFVFAQGGRYSSLAALPSGAILLQATVTPWYDQYGVKAFIVPTTETLTIGTTTQEGGAPSLTPGYNLFQDATAANVNTGMAMTAGGTNTYLGNNGAPSMKDTGGYLTVQTSGAITSGSLKVVISYQMKPGTADPAVA